MACVEFAKNHFSAFKNWMIIGCLVYTEFTISKFTVFLQFQEGLFPINTKHPHSLEILLRMEELPLWLQRYICNTFNKFSIFIWWINPEKKLPTYLQYLLYRLWWLHYMVRQACLITTVDHKGIQFLPQIPFVWSQRKLWNRSRNWKQAAVL